jgi:leucine dehydrogenase
MKTYLPPIFHVIDGYEKVMEFRDQPTNLHGFIAIHNTKRGPALGGTRLWNYQHREDALTDVLRLAKGMTYKAAGANLPLGGGKAVLIGDAKTIKSPSYFAAYGHYVDQFKGRYITAEDVNTTTEDMKAIAKETQHVVGREGKSGNPSPWTSYGVFVGILASVKEIFPNRTIKELSFAVQGVGQTGAYLIDHLLEAGVSRIFISDINPSNLSKIKMKYPQLVVVPQGELISQDVDVFCPCALGGIVDDANLMQLKAKVIAGSANNILLDDKRHGPKAQSLGILIAPDFIINAGGLINVYHEHHADYDADLVKKEIALIGERLTIIYQLAKQKNIHPFQAAIDFANQQLK